MQIGKFELLQCVGEGAMGRVYLARQYGEPRYVALKVLSLQEGLDPEYDLRFQHEQEIQANLSHPRLVRHLESGSAAGVRYIAMEFANGEALDELLERTGSLTVNRVVALGIELADALDYLHSRDVIHRDIKPANVILTNAGVKLLDFGLARTPFTPQFTQAGSVVGTLRYLAPELLLGTEASARTDIWSLGCLLYQAMTGSLPIPPRSPDERVYFHCLLERSIPDPRALRPSLPPALCELVMAMLDREPSRRIASARRVALQLRSMLRISGSSSRIWPRRLSCPVRHEKAAGVPWLRHRAVAAAAAVVALLVRVWFT